MTITSEPGPKAVRAQARQLLKDVAPLDYTAIVAHRPEAVEQLHRVLVELGITEPKPGESLDDYARAQKVRRGGGNTPAGSSVTGVDSAKGPGQRAAPSATAIPAMAPAATSASDARVSPNDVAKQDLDAQKRARIQAIQRQLLDGLSQVGFADRIGKVYDSAATRKLIPFKDVPHKRGLPAFALVVAPDYSPKAGIHGIFMNAQEVWSALLPHPAEQYQWQLRDRRRFSSVQEFTELVTLLSAGFPLP